MFLIILSSLNLHDKLDFMLPQIYRVIRLYDI